MESNLAQLYIRHIEPSNALIINQIGEEILSLYENPQSFLEIVSILSTPDMSSLIKQYAAVGLKKVIEKHLDFLISDLSTNQTPALNNLLQILLVEQDSIITSLISAALIPIFNKLGESWTAFTQLLFTLFTSNNVNTGLQLMTDFLPFASTEFVGQQLNTISQFLQSALNSTDTEILSKGIKLFSSLLQTKIPISQFSEIFLTIFQRSLIIFHQFLVNNDTNHAFESAKAISKIMKINPLFAPAPNIYQLIIQILSDGSIPVEIRHLPLFPIIKLIKQYGKELQPLFLQSSQVFLTIASQQFEDIGFDNLDGPQTIIPLFREMTNTVSDPSQFINVIFQNLCRTASPSESFASICAIFGIIESDCDEQIEKICPSFFEYSIEKVKLQVLTITQAVLRLFYDLCNTQSVPMTQYAGVICNLSLQLYQMHSNEDLTMLSLELIREIFYELDLDSSFIINFIPDLIKAYQQAHTSLKPYFMQCLSMSITTCLEDSVVFADALLPIVFQGSQPSPENDTSNRACCIEALGDFLACIPQKCQPIYKEAIELILAGSSDADFEVRSLSLKALINIIKFAGRDELPVDFTSYALISAFNATKLKMPEKDENVKSNLPYSEKEIIIDGFKLFYYLLKNKPNSCTKVIIGLPALIKSGFASNQTENQVTAIKMAAYFIIYFNPQQTDIYDDLFKMIVQSNDEEVVIASFKSYLKILSKSNNQLAPQNFQRFIEASFLCFTHQLPFQNGSIEYDEDVTTMLVIFYETIWEEQFHAFPQQKFIETVSTIITHVEEEESFQILEMLALFIKFGGVVTNEIVDFGLHKLQISDFSHGPEPINFIRQIIIKNPQIVADKIPTIVNLFGNQLSAQEVKLKYYWPRINCIISTIFTLMFSNTFNIEAIKSDQCILLILSKLPIKEYFNDASFIYKSIIDLIQLKKKTIGPLIPEIFRIFVQTLAFSQKKFEKLDLPQSICEQIVASIKHLFQTCPQLQQQVPQILNNDKVKISHFLSRMSNEN